MGFNDMEVEGNSDYIKFMAGQIVTFHILSQSPKKETVHWKNKKKTFCFGKDCEICAEGNKPKQRWTCAVWDRKDQKVKTMEFGTSIAGQIKAIAEMLAESQSNIHSVDIRVKTTGSGLDTEYNVLHAPVSGEIPADVREKYEVPF